MPRIPRDTSGHTKPKVNQRTNIEPEPTEMARRRQAVAGLVAHCMAKEDIIFTMRLQFPDMSPASIERMRAAAQERYEQEVRENVSVARFKQRARLLGTIGAARAKNALSVVVQAERLLAEIDGTLAPREIVISADAVTRDALAAILTILPKEDLHALANGKWVPLGHVGPNGMPALTVEGTDGSNDRQ